MKSCLSILLVLLLTVSLAACGAADADFQIDPAELTRAVLADVKFDSGLDAIDSKMLPSLYPELPEGVTATIYNAAGTSADELTVLTSPDEAAAKATYKAAEQYIQDRTELYAGYAPDEAAKLKRAAVVRRGRWVIVCVTDDVETAEATIDAYCDAHVVASVVPQTAE